MATQLSKNFTLEELIHTNHNISNFPPEKYMENGKNLANMLQGIRDAWQAPIIVTSGYRCEKLNKAVGGASNSQHMTFSAADIQAKNKKDNIKLWNLIIALKDKGDISTRQIIWEYGTKANPSWIHIANNDEQHSHKINQVLKLGVK